MSHQTEKLLASILFVVISSSSFNAEAFPEMVTHGYVNCTSCHVSPSGGGVLTEYGRGLSKELLSSSGGENEELFLNGLAKSPKWLLPGGDLRAIQTYLNEPREKSGEFFLMQAELSAAVRLAKWAVVATLGIKGGPNDVRDRNELVSRVHYALYNPSETTSLRAGRFMPQFGINEPNHTIVTRQGLGFNEDMESYNIEAAYSGENADAFVTGILGRPDDHSLDREKGVALTSSLNFFEKDKLGISALRAANSSASRTLAGLWGIFGLSHRIFLMSEIDLQWKMSKAVAAAETRGVVSYQRLGYEPLQGFQVYAVHQLSYSDFSTASSRMDAFGPGIDLFPRPHFEIRAEYLKERLLSAGSSYFDFAWLLLHYYF